MTASKTDVVDFLKRFKQEATTTGIQLIPRDKNKNGLATLGITIPAAESIILGLTEENYSNGPETDHDGSSGEIWFFCTLENGQQVYIKLKLEANKAKCLSFHPAAHSMPQPYKK